MRDFNACIAEGIVTKRSPDTSRAMFLKEEAKRSYASLLKRIEILGVTDETANDIVPSCYNIIMELIRAKMHMAGYKASGYGAHEAEVSYLEKLGFGAKDACFADQLRNFRNGILYYGTVLDKEYAQKVFVFTKKVYKRLT